MYFSVSPYQEILQGISTALEVNEGIIKITGKAGTGISALSAELHSRLEKDHKHVMHFRSPPDSPIHLQNTIIEFFELSTQGNFTKLLTAHLNNLPLEERVVYMVFNDAHKLDDQTLNSVRMLCNITDDHQALVRPIICGTKELDKKLELREYRSVAQYLSQSFVLKPMSEEEIGDFYWAYFHYHKLEVTPPNQKTITALHKHTQGLPGALLEKLKEILVQLGGSNSPEASLATDMPASETFQPQDNDKKPATFSPLATVFAEGDVESAETTEAVETINKDIDGAVSVATDADNTDTSDNAENSEVLTAAVTAGPIEDLTDPGVEEATQISTEPAEAESLSDTAEDPGEDSTEPETVSADSDNETVQESLPDGDVDEGEESKPARKWLKVAMLAALLISSSGGIGYYLYFKTDPVAVYGDFLRWLADKGYYQPVQEDAPVYAVSEPEQSVGTVQVQSESETQTLIAGSPENETSPLVGTDAENDVSTVVAEEVADQTAEILETAADLVEAAEVEVLADNNVATFVSEDIEETTGADVTAAAGENTQEGLAEAVEESLAAAVNESVVTEALSEQPLATEASDLPLNDIAADEITESATPLATPVAMASARRILNPWLISWMRQDVEGYLRMYHPDFSAPGVATLAAWREQRAANISSTQGIRLAYTDLEIVDATEAQIKVRFWLQYSAETYADKTLKDVTLSKDGEDLKIISEINLQVDKIR